MVSRDVTGLLDAEPLELELPLVPLVPVAELLCPVVAAVQTPNPVVEATNALVEGNRDAQTGLELREASKLEIAASWLFIAGSLALAHETMAEE